MPSVEQFYIYHKSELSTHIILKVKQSFKSHLFASTLYTEIGRMVLSLRFKPMMHTHTSV